MCERGIVEENLSVEKKKEKRSQIVPPEEEEEDKDVLERELDVFSFFFGRKVLSPQKVRETFGRRTAPEYNLSTHALR